MVLRRAFLAVVLILGLFVPGSGFGQATHRHKASNKQPPPPPPPPPPVPLTPEQMPANPPQVTYQGGQLTIVAQNSTLGDILRAVRNQTGAEVDVPGNATERVVSRLGPGPARDVLATLLNGSHFNYVMLGSANDTAGVEKVILTAKTAGAVETSAGQPDSGNGGQQAYVPPPPQPAAQAQSDDLSDVSDEMGDDNTLDDNNGQSENQPQVMQPGLPPQAQPGAPQPGIKTPEQLLQELQMRNQQLQQQQQQQQQNPQPPQ